MALNHQDLTATVNGSHTLKIQGFSLTKDMGIGKFISSDTFSVGGHSWRILFYPDGNDKEYVSLYIELVSKCDGGVNAYTEFALLDQSGNKWTNKNRPDELYTIGPFMEGPDTIETTLGFIEFYKRSELEESQFIKDDCLNMQCTVSVVKTTKTVAQLSELGRRNGQLLESMEGSDVTFEVEGETFHAHKVILSTWSPVFKAQFFGPLKEENTQCIKIEEIQAPVFKVLLRFIYCDVIPNVVEDLVGLEFTKMIQHLLVAADRYGSERLKSLCESILCKNIDVNIVASTLALAEQHGCIKLKSMCLEFILLPENLYDVMQTDGYKNLKESCPSVIDELIESLARGRDCTCVTFGQKM